VIRRAIAGAAATAAVLAPWACGPEPATDPDYGKNTSCQEDEACWDCETMGNMVCGPGHDSERGDP
jgi:hypothetical protein